MSATPDSAAGSNSAPAQPTHSAKVEFRIQLDPCVNFAMQQNAVTPLKEVALTNLGEVELNDVVIRIRAEPEFMLSIEHRIESIGPRARHVVADPGVRLLPAMLAGLHERLEALLHIEVSVGGATVHSEQRSISVLAYDQWGGLRVLPELLSAFVLPNHPAVAAWLRASAALLEKWTEDPSLSGYQLKSAERVAKMAAAIFHTLQSAGVTYINPPASFEDTGQKIRTPDRVHEERMATCLDLAVLSAACLEQCGLHALLIIVDGHALTGVWLEEKVFPDTTIEDAALLAKRVDLGEILIFDPTLTTNRPARSFEDATREANQMIREAQGFRCVIDVTRCRKGGVRPLPLRAHGVQLDELDTPTRPNAPEFAPRFSLPGSAPLSATVETPASRIDRWKRRLLDLTARNRLLNFRETKKTIALAHAKLAELEDVLSEGRTLTLRARLGEMRADGEDTRPVDADTLAKLVSDELTAGRLVTRFTTEQLEDRLTDIYRAAREGVEEGGASGLYLAIGFVEWFEDRVSTQARRAPLVLIPVDLERGSIRQGFRLTRGADDTRFNTTLLEMLRLQHDVEIEGVDPLPEDTRGIDTDAVLHAVLRAIATIPRWRVIHEAQLGFFTFAKFLMWKDLDEQAEVLLQNRIVSHLVHRPDTAFDPDLQTFASEALDDRTSSSELYCPVLADSSQLTAVLAAASGKSFVLEGPPGTGKSQTITNLISHCLATGKTVLFVSEKTAALNVVFDRLKRIGLERFCLELHSNKASKQKVIHELGRALHAAHSRSPDDWDAVATELDEVRAELNSYARAVGTVHTNGLSVFRAVSSLTELRDVPTIMLERVDLEALDRATLERQRSHLRDAESALQVTGTPHRHPLAGVQIEDVPAGLQDHIAQAFEAARACTDAFVQDGESLAAKLGVVLFAANRRELEILATASEVALTAPSRGAKLLTLAREDADRIVDDVCGAGRRRDELRTLLSKSFELRIVEMDLITLRGRVRATSAAWAPARWWGTRGLRKSLSAVMLEGNKPTLDEMKLAVERAIELRDVEKSLAAAIIELDQVSGVAWRAESTPWDEIDGLNDWTHRAREALASTTHQRAVGQWIHDDGEARELAKRVLARSSQMFRALEDVASVLRFSAHDVWNDRENAGAVVAWRERMALIEPELPRLRPWALWQRIRRRLDGDRLGDVVTAVEQGRIRADQLVRCFNRSYFEAWLAWARSQTPILRDFLSASHEQRIERFRELDRKCTEMARRVIAARLCAAVPAPPTGGVPGSELGVLQRQVQLQRRHMGLRQLFQQTRTLVQRLKPCFLMSPISVAQYLPPGRLSFDIVVFDEASQIPTWDAVGAIARGEQAIVVGDSKQLPPTSFFDTVADEEADEESIEELESILDECRAANIPPLDLKWHYRSRHESLISFSNRKYYDNRLLTFPAAHIAGLGVQWRHVAGGVYDMGHTRTNRAEAETLVAEIVRRLRDPELSAHSIGAVTFSSTQQALVEDLLDAARRADPSLDLHFISSDKVPEPVFVKNLENVQGDERDVILFSICYGPDERGRVSMNFGPLNQQGGQRRLNVAVTRARRELIVFSTLTADQIDLSRTRATGVADLRLFLAYAQYGVDALPKQAESIDENEHFESPLEHEIAEALRDRGYTVHSQVGCSGYRIDLAVVHPDAPDRYLLGIECDGRYYHAAKTARDRDALRQSVLLGLGWALARVWSSDWWESREEQLERLCARIETARAESTPKPPAPSSPTDPSPTSASEGAPTPESADPTGTESSVFERPPAPQLTKYRATSIATIGSQDDFYDEMQRRKLERALQQIVNNEGPVRLELLALRVATAFGFSRTRQVAVERVDRLASALGIQRTVHGERTFLWPKDIHPTEWRGFRVSDSADTDQRAGIDLPPEEIGNAALHLLTTNGSCPRRELQRALSRMFGFKALGSALANHLDQGIEQLARDSRVRICGDDRVELAE